MEDIDLGYPRFTLDELREAKRVADRLNPSFEHVEFSMVYEMPMSVFLKNPKQCGIITGIGLDNESIALVPRRR